MTGAGRPRVALLAAVAGAMIVALDGTVLLVAQPDLRRDLGSTVTQVQWTSTGYLLAVAAFLVIAGRLGDRYGHQRLLLVGVTGFGAASAGIALAPGAGWVVALRVVQGVFGALLQPATLALLRLACPPDRLGAAIALRTSAIGVAAGTGPLLGGFLVAHLGWRAVFLVNVPVALVIAALTLAVGVPATPGSEAEGPTSSPRPCSRRCSPRWSTRWPAFRSTGGPRRRRSSDSLSSCASRRRSSCVNAAARSPSCHLPWHGRCR